MFYSSHAVNQILIWKHELDPEGQSVVLAGPRAGHLLHVLRVTTGASVRVGVINALPGRGVVTAIEDGCVRLRCEFDEKASPMPAVDLLLALPRPKVLRRLWAQLAALGVGQIFITNADRVERCYFDTHVLSPETYEPLLVEGLQQARDVFLPRVSVHRQFRVLVEDVLAPVRTDALRVVAHPGSPASVADVARGHDGQRVLLAVGPEGGWNDFELRLLDEHGFRAASLGPRTLRSDTACLALLAVVHEAIRTPPGPQSHRATENESSR